MKCPSCSFKIKSLNELSSSEHSIPWYKYSEELIRCPNCQTHVKIVASKKTHLIFALFFIVSFSLVITVLIFSKPWFLPAMIVASISSMLVAKYLYIKKGALVEDNT